MLDKRQNVDGHYGLILDKTNFSSFSVKHRQKLNLLLKLLNGYISMHAKFQYLLRYVQKFIYSVSIAVGIALAQCRSSSMIHDAFPCEPWYLLTNSSSIYLLSNHTNSEFHECCCLLLHAIANDTLPTPGMSPS